MNVTTAGHVLRDWISGLVVKANSLRGIEVQPPEPQLPELQNQMEGRFPFAANLTSLNQFLMKHDINLDTYWKMVGELNDKTAILLKRIEATRKMQAENGVMWMSFAVLIGVIALIVMGRGLVLLFGGQASGKRQHRKKVEEIDVMSNGHENGIVANGNGHPKKTSDGMAEIEVFKLRGELKAAREEITRLMPFRDEAEGLTAKLGRMDKDVDSDERTLQSLTSLEKDLADAKSECRKLKEAIKTKDIEMGKLRSLGTEPVERERLASLEKDLASSRTECDELKSNIGTKYIEITKFQLFEIEAKELRSHMEAYREDATSKDEVIAQRDKDIETLKSEKEKIEKDLEEAYKEFEIVTQRAAESCEIEEKLRIENTELTKKLANLDEAHVQGLKAVQDMHEGDLAKQQLAHEQEKQQLRDEYEGKVKEAKDGTRRRSDSIASLTPSELDGTGSPTRRTPNRLLASIKRHSRSSLSGSSSDIPTKISRPGSSSKDLKTAK
ncbi:uncharacterized protein PAC_09692 [Phialocephala subalpina]|uniref:Uncharacterized protein n=1 Tax=Phialocephala subalpina TaxID=576137 RepID=A0A1L7X449_9HELO|nr:uncharacterized protein PAC_09692 [Phialocephala subalpina]